MSKENKNDIFKTKYLSPLNNKSEGKHDDYDNYLHVWLHLLPNANIFFQIFNIYVTSVKKI